MKKFLVIIITIFFITSTMCTKSNDFVFPDDFAKAAKNSLNQTTKYKEIIVEEKL